MKNIIKTLFSRIVDVSFIDVLSIFKFALSLPFVMVYKVYLKLAHENIWVICEEKYEARDNAFVLFKYIRNNYPQERIVYAINKKSKDAQKVLKYGPIVDYGGFKHWIYYLSATANISSQKGGKPNAAVCYLLEVVLKLVKNNRFFLQHGVIMNNTTFLHYEETQMRLFVCGAFPEYKYVSENFGYPKNYVQYLGLARFDELHNLKFDKKKILLMPTWRNWFNLKSKNGLAQEDDFNTSEYFYHYQSLINNKKLLSYLEKKNVELYFYPHRNVQTFLSSFSSSSDRIVICSYEDYDIQELLRTCHLMITDYSSVNIDFAYMKKPIIYYQFDYEKFRRVQYDVGYFDYKRDGFGPVVDKEEEVVDEIISYIEKDYILDENLLNKHREFFKLYDSMNCERNYIAIKSILKED